MHQKHMYIYIFFCCCGHCTKSIWRYIYFFFTALFFCFCQSMHFFFHFSFIFILFAVRSTCYFVNSFIKSSKYKLFFIQFLFIEFWNVSKLNSSLKQINSTNGTTQDFLSTFLNFKQRFVNKCRQHLGTRSPSLDYFPYQFLIN